MDTDDIYSPDLMTMDELEALVNIYDNGRDRPLLGDSRCTSCSLVDRSMGSTSAVMVNQSSTMAVQEIAMTSEVELNTGQLGSSAGTQLASVGDGATTATTSSLPNCPTSAMVATQGLSSGSGDRCIELLDFFQSNQQLSVDIVAPLVISTMIECKPSHFQYNNPSSNWLPAPPQNPPNDPTSHLVDTRNDGMPHPGTGDAIETIPMQSSAAAVPCSHQVPLVPSGSQMSDPVAIVAQPSPAVEARTYHHWATPHNPIIPTSAPEQTLPFMSYNWDAESACYTIKMSAMPPKQPENLFKTGPFLGYWVRKDINPTGCDELTLRAHTSVIIFEIFNDLRCFVIVEDGRCGITSLLDLESRDNAVEKQRLDWIKSIKAMKGVNDKRSIARRGSRICRICAGKPFERNWLLKRHLGSVHSRRLHRCKYCHRHLSREDALTRHEKSCSGNTDAHS